MVKLIIKKITGINIGIFLIFLFTNLISSCGDKPVDSVFIEKLPEIFPDYTFVTIPNNIAPLNFELKDSCEEFYVQIVCNGTEEFMDCNKKLASITIDKWKDLLNRTKGDSLVYNIHIKKKDMWYRLKAFSIYVANEEIDPYLVYRLIPPGYQTWNEMGLYQRNLTSFEENPVITSELLPFTCMNCHSFANKNPDNMVFHLREVNNATILYQNGKLKQLQTKTEQTFGNAAFPYWHPGGKFIAFSIDKVIQIFHSKGLNRADALDLRSDIVIYDIENNSLLTSDLIFSENNFETFPCFSPDGRVLYFCSAKNRKMPEEFDAVKYSICSIGFDAESKKFDDKVDTLVSAIETGKSCSIPRISPDGKFLSFNMMNHGNFPAYNPESDIYLMNLSSKEYYPLTQVNSNDVDSYHSWSSNSRWLVVSSRRIDGLYMRPFISYIDSTGKAEKPFLLPQEDPDFYQSLLFSFNVPEFSTKRVELNANRVEELMKEEGIQVKFRKVE